MNQLMRLFRKANTIQGVALLAFGILGVWLIYWDLTDYVNSALHNLGIPPAVFGLIIIIFVGAFGIKVFK